MDEITNKNTIREQVDVCVIGAGHAGCEAALACARLGLETVIFTVSVDSIALMPCNPNVGGSSKGHLVRELDALGGEMGKNIDKTFIQSKMLNQSKGPAVHSLRAQADKAEYTREMRNVLENQEHLTIKHGEVCEIITESYDGAGPETTQRITGIKTYTGAIYECKAAVICSGTYLKARCLCGEAITYTGPNGLQPANHLSESLREHGIEIRRFKTGTPARMDKRSIDFDQMEEQFGDERIVPFSFSTNPEDVQIDQVSCYLTYTNEKTHEIIRANLDRSPIYAGIIEGTGPRYCPSIEDKVVKFSDKERHQVFIEPEGLHTNEMYVGGMSSSLPEDVQLAMYRTVKGLEHCRIVRNAYAIEYDCLSPKQLTPSLELKKIKGLFCGGQFNGSSGYEEAAVQGLMAGINASLEIQGKEPLILDRSEAYIGVLIDDLVTKENREPYRMMTSRAEYRLLLRQDNADLRLRKYGYQVGLVTKEQYDFVCRKEEMIEKEVARMFETTVGANQTIQEFLQRQESATVKKSTSMAELICRPELSYELLEEIDTKREELPQEVVDQININIKYDGYIKRQQQQVKQFKKMETRRIPENINYDDVPSLRIEARQKLEEFRPINVGQASRISGVSPADISVLLVYLEH
ncbi:MAG TPA: tRNA uridine-5-carboxymethylaminomethyl(34) synthesis enzyme MnmG [Lachnospiraceae bacterium]|nr:tRNA uridine-5-carboxymethylaminomethyl(34) synthesis enzyme MnmG [Lachnospiraceae bacterium]